MLNKLIQRLEQVAALSTTFKVFLLEHLTEQTITRDEFLLKPVEVSNRIVFLGKGIMYAYRYFGDCRVTNRIYLIGQLCIDPVSYFTNAPSMEYIAPITKECTVYELDATAQAEAARFPEWAVLWERIIVDTIIRDEALLYMFRTMRARERYEWIREHYPGIAENTTKEQFATWMGMTLATIHRIEQEDRLTRKWKK